MIDRHVNMSEAIDSGARSLVDNDATTRATAMFDMPADRVVAMIPAARVVAALVEHGALSGRRDV